MGTWADITPYKVNQLIDATALDTLRTNIEYLQAPNYAEYHHPGTGSNYTVTGNLGQDINASFNLSITTYGGLVMGVFYGQWGISVDSAIRTNIVRTDPVSHVGVNLFSSFAVEIVSTTATNTEPRGWIQVFPDVPAGTHEFRAIWGVPSGTATLFVANRPYMAVFEV